MLYLYRLACHIIFRASLSLVIILWLLSQFCSYSVEIPQTFSYHSLHAFTDRSRIYLHQRAFRNHWGPPYRIEAFRVALLPLPEVPTVQPPGNYTTVFSMPGIKKIRHDPMGDFTDLPRTFVTISQPALWCYIAGLYFASLSVPRLIKRDAPE